MRQRTNWFNREKCCVKWHLENQCLWWIELFSVCGKLRRKPTVKNSSRDICGDENTKRHTKYVNTNMKMSSKKTKSVLRSVENCWKSLWHWWIWKRHKKYDTVKKDDNVSCKTWDTRTVKIHCITVLYYVTLTFCVTLRQRFCIFTFHVFCVVLR